MARRFPAHEAQRHDPTYRTPYPSDFPMLISDYNPACLCGHAREAHDYSGDEIQTAWGVCDVEGCACEKFRDEMYGDEE